MKNLLAVIGLFVVLQKGHAFYREYIDLKRDAQSRPAPGRIRTRQSRSFENPRPHVETLVLWHTRKMALSHPIP